MKIFFTRKGSPIIELDLDSSKEYVIGRSSEESDIRLYQRYISRKHAKLYYSDGKWWYQDLRVGNKSYHAEPIPLTSENRIVLEGKIDLVTDTYLSLHKTMSYDVVADEHGRHKYFRPRYVVPIFLFFVVIVGAVLGYLYYRQSEDTVDVNKLYNVVREKVVEFEEVRDLKIIEEIKKYANLTDSDFKAEVGFCSGFIVGKNIVLTASHCVLGPYLLDVRDDFVIKTYDKKIHRATKILGFNLDYDYLFLEVPGLEKYKPFDFETKYKIGEKAYTVGNVHGQGIAIREGITASKTQDEYDPSIERLRFSAGASPGNSGGPLVNAKGKVIGIVFARSNFSENYNIATEAKELKKGFSQFVQNRKEKQIDIDTKNFPQYYFMSFFNMFGFPFSYEWREYPEKLKDLTQIKFDITVPTDLQGIYSKIYQPFYKQLREKFKKVGQEIAAESKGKFLKETWESQVSSKIPLIIPFPVYDDIFVESVSEAYFVERDSSFYFPASSYSYEAFEQGLKDKKYYYRPEVLVAEIVKPEEEKNKEVLDEKSVASEEVKNSEVDEKKVDSDRKIAKPKKKDFFLYETKTYTDKKTLYPGEELYVQLDFAKGDTKDSSLPNKEERDDIILGEKGISVIDIKNNFLRPNSFTAFTLKELPESSVAEVRDLKERTWKVYTWKLFGQYVVDMFCLPLPQGFSCISSKNIERNQFFDRLRHVYVIDSVLSKVIFRPKFWNPEAIIEYKNKGYGENLEAFDDVLIEKKGEDFEVTLKSMGVKINFPKKDVPVMMRIIPALYDFGDSKKWIAVGITGYYSQAKDDNGFVAKFCGVDLQLDELPPYFYSTLYQKDMDDGQEDKALFEKIKFKANILNKDVTMAMFCQYLKEHEEGDKSSDAKFGFDEYIPHNFDFQLVGATPITVNSDQLPVNSDQ